jgi:hypothetical protein
MVAFRRLGFFNRDLAGTQLSVIEFEDSGLAFQIGGHFNEPKTLGPARGSIHHDLDLLYPAAGRENFQ